jgi:hypothetical protein
MSRVKQIENELEKLSIAELKEVREWLDNFVEDRMEFTPEFESMIRESEQEMNSGIQPRVKKP